MTETRPVHASHRRQTRERSLDAPWLRAAEAALFLGVSRPTLYKWVKQGRIPEGRRLSPRVHLWARADLEAFISSAQA